MQTKQKISDNFNIIRMNESDFFGAEEPNIGVVINSATPNGVLL